MKTIVKLAVLCVTLLLVTGVAFADWCQCYLVIITGVNNPSIREIYYDKICLDYGSHSGSLTSDGFSIDLSLFPDRKMLGYGSDCVAYYKFHGHENAGIDGLETCSDIRLKVHGYVTDWNYCVDD